MAEAEKLQHLLESPCDGFPHLRKIVNIVSVGSNHACRYITLRSNVRVLYSSLLSSEDLAKSVKKNTRVYTQLRISSWHGRKSGGEFPYFIASAAFPYSERFSFPVFTPVILVPFSCHIAVYSHILRLTLTVHGVYCLPSETT